MPHSYSDGKTVATPCTKEISCWLEVEYAGSMTTIEN